MKSAPPSLRGTIRENINRNPCFLIWRRNVGQKKKKKKESSFYFTPWGWARSLKKKISSISIGRMLIKLARSENLFYYQRMSFWWDSNSYNMQQLYDWKKYMGFIKRTTTHKNTEWNWIVNNWRLKPKNNKKQRIVWTATLTTIVFTREEKKRDVERCKESSLLLVEESFLFHLLDFFFLKKVGIISP